MTFPIEILTDVPLWYNWIGNVGAITIIGVVIFIVIAFDDYKNRGEEIGFILGFTVIGFIVAGVWAAGWGLIVALLIPGIILYAIRLAIQGIRNLYFYMRYDR